MIPIKDNYTNCDIDIFIVILVFGARDATEYLPDF